MSTRRTTTRLGFTSHVTVDGGRRLYTWSALGKLGAIVLQAREVDARHQSLFEGMCHRLADGTLIYGTDIGRHTAQPVTEWDEARTDGCSFLEGVPCHYDGSSLQAEYIFRAWEATGWSEEHLQATLTDYYRSWILGEEDA